MKREEAIQVLQTALTAPFIYGVYADAISMAIEALQTDAVSREAYYDAVANRITDMEERGFVQVVRCKDCRWWQDDYMGTWCSGLSGVRSTNADDYCSWGERREP